MQYYIKKYKLSSENQTLKQLKTENQVTFIFQKNHNISNTNVKNCTFRIQRMKNNITKEYYKTLLQKKYKKDKN